MLALTPVEIIAIIFALASLVKLSVIVIEKKKWHDHVVKPVYGNPRASSVVFGILALVVFYFLIQELSIVQIYAVMAFCGLIIGLGFMTFTQDITALLEKTYRENFGPTQWVFVLTMFLLLLWVLYAIGLSVMGR